MNHSSRLMNEKQRAAWLAKACAALVFCAITAIALPAQIVTPLHSFDGTDGANPYAGLVQGTDGNLYGTTAQGGPNTNGLCFGGGTCGTVFKITPSGALTTLYNFCSQSNCTDGAIPGAAPLVQAANGNFCGTTTSGGANGDGTVFEFTPAGVLTTLHSFDGTDGAGPNAGLVQATDGNLYGTTTGGGANADGTVFEITPGGVLTTLHSFDGTDGANPPGGGGALVQATNGNFYGTTANGGANGFGGTVFEITPSGALTTLYSFCSQSGCTDGANPNAGLIQGADGNFYGTTYCGGIYLCGTAFKITPSGTLTRLYSFGEQFSLSNYYPEAGLVQGTDGKFYGTTYGGDNQCGGSCGTVFKITPITPNGTLKTLWRFGITGGAYPAAGLVQNTNGKFYGTTVSGGPSNSCYEGCGTIFSLSVGLGPFVETVPATGKVGASVIILGTDLTGATSVTFNGTAATFTVVSGSEITTTVPADATSGKVQVVTPGSGTLNSNAPFRVLP